MRGEERRGERKRGEVVGKERERERRGVMMIMMILVMMMRVQLRDPVFEAENWPRKRRTPRANVRSR